MRRIRIIYIAIILGILGAILPMILAFWLSWKHAVKEEQQVLMEYSNRMLQKAVNTLDSVRQLTPLLQNLKIKTICSNEHIEKIRMLSLFKLENKLIAYFENNIEKCNSYGLSNMKVERQKADFTLPDGLEFVINAQIIPDYTVPLIGLRKAGNYDTYIRPGEFTDIIIPAGIRLAISYKGQILSEKNNPDHRFIRKILDKSIWKIQNTAAYNEKIRPAKSISENMVFILDKNLVSLSHYGPFFFIAMEPESWLYKKFINYQYIFLPFGLLSGFFIMALVYYFSSKQLSFRSELLSALKNHEFFLQYQPIIDLQNGVCAGAEALVRWRNAEGKLIRPDLFIPYAEEMGMVPKITDEIVDILFRDMKTFLEKNPGIHISINLTASDLMSGRILHLLEKKFSKTSIAPEQIWLELTEGVFIEADKVNKTLKEASAKGHTILIDDFGTGYSNLSYLQNIAIDILKIDKSFINTIGIQSATSSVADHIISMAKELKLKLVAEGVETQIQLDYLKARQVEYIQGYLFSKPLDAKAFIQFVRRPEILKSVGRSVDTRSPLKKKLKK